MKKYSYDTSRVVQTVKTVLAETCYRFFSALSNPTRLAILEELRNGPRNVNQISEALGQEQSMISHNLKPLVTCRFVFVEKKWKERLYSLNRETMEPIFKTFSFHAEKYCPTKGECLDDWRRRANKSDALYVKHH